jgi:poly(ribitol-phosphate) beta-N-acetylglucosaminyltransferase
MKSWPSSSPSLTTPDLSNGVADVTVIVAVYNTMPYLRRCLTSLVRQTIGLSRLEVIAVDDGSTDGSGAELDRFVRRFPDTFTVVHQTNSGGPAMPSNRALRLATGRYVFFVGADDYLGREALERLVAAADRYGSDVVAGRMVGSNGRFVPKAIFARTDPDVDFYTSTLPFAVSNTKLFRRQLLVDHDIWFPLDLPFGSDQPFTVAACVHAARISVLADYDYYFAVRRHNASNITYQSSHRQRLACTAQIMAATAGLLPAGAHRDAVLHRSFAAELSKLTRPDFLTLDRPTQTLVAAGIGRLADQYLTEPIAARLDVSRRVRLRLAQHHDLDALLGVIRQNDGRQPLSLTPEHDINGDRLYAGYSGFRDPDCAYPDAWYLVTESPTESVARHLDQTTLTWQRHGRTALTLTARSPHQPATVTSVNLHLVVGHVRTTVTVKPDPHGSTIGAEFRPRDLLSHRPRWADSLPVRVAAGVASNEREVPLRLAGPVARRERLGCRGLRVYIIRPVRGPDGELAIEVVPVTAGRVARRVRQILLRDRNVSSRASGESPGERGGTSA